MISLLSAVYTNGKWCQKKFVDNLLIVSFNTQSRSEILSQFGKTGLPMGIIS